MKAGFNKLIAHGVTGGVQSRLSGGSFKSGFLGSAGYPLFHLLYCMRF
jgi:hypothetical protein